MEHLTREALAKLVDETPDLAESEHLGRCRACSGELAALREQTAALGGLPELLPPRGDWRVLEARLRSEGLLRDARLSERLGLARTPTWMRVAAAVLLFLGGAGAGSLATSRAESTGASNAGSFASVEDAAAAVRLAEEGYVTAVARYRELLAEAGSTELSGDPISRYAALEHLVLVSQAAVRQAPGDPFLNGFLASALAERDAAARLVSSSRDNWF